MQRKSDLHAKVKIELNKNILEMVNSFQRRQDLQFHFASLFRISYYLQHWLLHCQPCLPVLLIVQTDAAHLPHAVVAHLIPTSFCQMPSLKPV